ncbi:endonuclease/exonuclease/phosphatase family metal-dependent hydrolase [Primorskyibacter sedentarius]|uniref:Endonuclease/exonuclease/phosphatase family metal-dependent hydrolase n=2 Tax=Primorskyibacter sedentarius TaxID=745311 RepID=A0A4V2UPK4_9RHOB|nr:endonuclease/exonuclease/phosphatase family metal-dependent hydrolase [Primorskyibacter sedentarius]
MRPYIRGMVQADLRTNGRTETQGPILCGQSLVRVTSYNIRKAVGLDWRRDSGRIVDVLAEIDADVVVLQESDKRVGKRSGVLPEERLQHELGYRLVDVSTRPHSHGWHGNAILYRPNRLSLDKAKRIDLPTVEPRGAVAAVFAAPGLEVIGVHLALMRSVRARQMQRLGQYLATASHPIIVAGDFNAWAKEGHRAALGKGCEMILPGNSFHASRPVAALDRFVLKGAVMHAASHVHVSALASRASDHLPIVIDLDLSGDPQ